MGTAKEEPGASCNLIRSNNEWLYQMSQESKTSLFLKWELLWNFLLKFADITIMAKIFHAVGEWNCSL